MTVSSISATPTAAKPARERDARRSFRINGTTELSDGDMDKAILALNQIHALSSFMDAAFRDAAEFGERSEVETLNSTIKAAALGTISTLAAQARFALDQELDSPNG